jgi:2-polyprenyl-3-methyl-5-hydroxy-6-metoxy-1,4-benzoquinol methylase
VSSLTDFLDAVNLVCPDDRGPLVPESKTLRCTRCGSLFPVFENRIIDILPKARAELQDDLASGYRDDYLELAAHPLTPNMAPWAWGTRSTHTAREIERRANRVAWLGSILVRSGPTRDLVLCDVSAGAGHYSLAYASRFRYVLHCDLVPNAALYAYQEANASGIENVLFLRHDYLQSPLSQSADIVICMDTMIRGRSHELALAASILDAVKPGGLAVLDFANMRRQFARRTLQPRQRLSTDTRAYTRSQVVAMLEEVGFAAVELVRMPGSRLLPQPRLVFLARRGSLGD